MAHSHHQPSRDAAGPGVSRPTRPRPEHDRRANPPYEIPESASSFELCKALDADPPPRRRWALVFAELCDFILAKLEERRLLEDDRPVAAAAIIRRWALGEADDQELGWAVDAVREGIGDLAEAQRRWVAPFHAAQRERSRRRGKNRPPPQTQEQVDEYLRRTRSDRRRTEASEFVERSAEALLAPADLTCDEATFVLWLAQSLIQKLDYPDGSESLAHERMIQDEAWEQVLNVTRSVLRQSDGTTDSGRRPNPPSLDASVDHTKASRAADARLCEEVDANPPDRRRWARALAAVCGFTLDRLEAARMLDDDRLESAVSWMRRWASGDASDADLNDAAEEVRRAEEERSARERAWWEEEQAKGQAAPPGKKSKRPVRPPRAPRPARQADLARHIVDVTVVRARAFALHALRDAFEFLTAAGPPAPCRMALFCLRNAAGAVRLTEAPLTGKWSQRAEEALKEEARAQVQAVFTAGLDGPMTQRRSNPSRRWADVLDGENIADSATAISSEPPAPSWWVGAVAQVCELVVERLEEVRWMENDLPLDGVAVLRRWANREADDRDVADIEAEFVAVRRARIGAGRDDDLAHMARMRVAEVVEFGLTAVRTYPPDYKWVLVFLWSACNALDAIDGRRPGGRNASERVLTQSWAQVQSVLIAALDRPTETRPNPPGGSRSADALREAMRALARAAPSHSSDAPSGGAWDRRGPEPVWRQPHRELVRDAVASWKGDPVTVRLHLDDELAGASQPSSGGGKVHRAQARALLEELATAAKPTPRALYRGSHVAPDGLQAWTERVQVAREWAAKNGGRVFVLPAGTRGIRTADYYGGIAEEREWLVADPSGFRAFEGTQRRRNGATKDREPAPMLYRTARGRPNTSGAFWTPAREYARMVHPDTPLYRARIVRGAIVRFYQGSPTKAILAQARRDGVHVAVFPIWDWPDDEYVVINPEVLADVVEVVAEVV